ncbi:conserved hypothetical protein [Ricinus communis]|uniref:Prolamin-like domain-containing protein n=1 Tax=Ricinus communis TaxID=3988 RepID=B9SXP3_RICCO|nr:conserved hypothetical protein [Ricinus communis]
MATFLAQTRFVLLLAVVSIVAADTFGTDQIPASIMPVSPGQCLAPFLGISGCQSAIKEIEHSSTTVSSPEMAKLISPCCQVVNKINMDCWPYLLPSKPEIGKQLKNICAEAELSPSPAVAATNPSN